MIAIDQFQVLAQEQVSFAYRTCVNVFMQFRHLFTHMQHCCRNRPAASGVDGWWMGGAAGGAAVAAVGAGERGAGVG